MSITNGVNPTAPAVEKADVVRGRLQNRPIASQKQVLLAARRGYCAGVDRAVVAVDKALVNYGARGLGGRTKRLDWQR